MKGWPDGCVDTVVTSPPYWGLRDYGVAGQLGLEKTPEEYVEKMVEGFREVRRVLADHGTLWLNLGDSYTGGTRDKKSFRRDKAEVNTLRQKNGPGLKPKDLCGIPWMVAKALQEPYYTGRIRNIQDRVWLAAMIDAEGCPFMHKRKAGQSNGQGYFRKNDNYGPSLEIANTHEAIVQRCRDITALGSICRVERETKKKMRNIPLYRWNLRTTQCRDVIREIYPHLVGKQHQARLVIGCPSSGKDAEKAHASLIALHNGKEACIDFPAPPTMFEQGWWLRQGIIWSKNNPMPESCRDRCTKSHEDLFILTKKPRYYFDQEAISEPCSESTHARISQDLANQVGSHRAYGGKKGNGPMKAVVKGSSRKMAAAGSGIKANDSFETACCLQVGTRNRRSVWTIPTQAYSEAHFATFPEKLVEPCIKAACPMSVCRACGKPRERLLHKQVIKRVRPNQHVKYEGGGPSGQIDQTKAGVETTTTGWTDCGCGAGFRRGIVLDPFGGSCTTAVVAHEHGRGYVMIELSPEYVEMGRKRIGRQTEKYGLLDGVKS